MKTYLLGITGASGSLYADRTARALLDTGATLHIIATDMGRKVLPYELGESYEGWLSSLPGRAIAQDNHDLFASSASGSFPCDGMIVVPCSMSTLGQMAAGITPSLLLRAADVTLKQRRPLILVPRETPLSRIHLKNMLALSEGGAMILPAMPGFYQHPRSIDDLAGFMAGRILDCLGIENTLYQRWNEERNSQHEYE